MVGVAFNSRLSLKSCYYFPYMFRMFSHFLIWGLKLLNNYPLFVAKHISVKPVCLFVIKHFTWCLRFGLLFSWERFSVVFALRLAG